MSALGSQKEFFSKNQIADAIWAAANVSWSTLEGIAQDHINNFRDLNGTAELLASVIQAFPSVHSVRWRVKDASHLIEKIIRKKAAKRDGYENICMENYYSIVTDLVGLRAIHLFKDQFFDIDQSIRRTWTPTQKPLAYVSRADPMEFISQFSTENFTVNYHDANYRSVHYIVETKPVNREVFSEIQVRTIFEEGWSEIDHLARYPKLPDSPMLSYYLNMFSTLAGSADLMGGFVNALKTNIKELQKTQDERDKALIALELTVAQLKDAKSQDSVLIKKINELEVEVAKFRNINSIIPSQYGKNLTPGSSINWFANNPLFSRQEPSKSSGLTFGASSAASHVKQIIDTHPLIFGTTNTQTKADK